MFFASKKQLVELQQNYQLQYKEVQRNLNESLNDYTQKLSKTQEAYRSLQNKRTRLETSFKWLSEQNEIDNFSKEKFDKIIRSSEIWFHKNLHELGFEQIPSRTDIDNQIEVIKSIGDLSVYYPNKLNQLVADYKVLTKDIRLSNKLLNKLSDFDKYRIPKDYETIFPEYSQLEEKIRASNEKLTQVGQYIEDVKNWFNFLEDKQKNLLDQYIKNHKIIPWIYKTINPHPFHKELKIKVENKGTNFVSGSAEGFEMYLDQIFSAAQLNILSLSVFLGIGLTHHYSELNQLFLDDPIQSMDDINILAFIDVIRAILDSKTIDKRLIVSTHDDDFAELLAIKMRNKNITQYKLESYGEEGPIFNVI